MKKIINVTFPRSGHHWLVNELTSLSGNTYNYNGKTISGRIIEPHMMYCPCYSHCNFAPCIDADTTWTKTHDFELLTSDSVVYLNAKEMRHVSPDLDFLYVVQIREMEDCLRSLWKFHESEPHWANIDYSDFYRDHKAYYERFCDKWLEARANRMIINYSDMLDDIDGVVSAVKEWTGIRHTTRDSVTSGWKPGQTE